MAKKKTEPTSAAIQGTREFRISIFRGVASVVLPVIEPGIGDFGDALWYCFAIVTTIGFGDISAVSVPGRILSVILGFYGIIVNLPAIMKSIGEAAEAISPL